MDLNLAYEVPDYYENQSDSYENQSDSYENQSDSYASAHPTGDHQPSSAQTSTKHQQREATPHSHKCALTSTTVLLSVTMVASLAALAVGITALATGAQGSGEVERRLTECMEEVEVSYTLWTL